MEARAISDSVFIAIYSNKVVTLFIKLLCKIDSIKEFILTTKQLFSINVGHL